MILPKTVSSWEECLLALGILFVAYTWILYPSLLWVFRRVTAKPQAVAKLGGKPRVSVILPVHNEQELIELKLQECLGLQYPPELLEILVVSDSCTDSTEQLVEEIAARNSR